MFAIFSKVFKILNIFSLPRFFKILALVFLTTTLCNAQPLPLTNSQRQIIQKLDSIITQDLKEAKSADDYANVMLTIIGACSISGYYVNVLNDDDFDNLAKFWGGNVPKDLQEKWMIFGSLSLQMLWASAHGDIINDNQEIQKSFSDCLATRYSAQKLGISKLQAELLGKGLALVIKEFDAGYDNGNPNAKKELVDNIKMLYELRNGSLEAKKLMR